jgi:hypothetical protein
VVTVKITLFCDMTACSLADVYQCYRSTGCETLVKIDQPTQHHIPEDSFLHQGFGLCIAKAELAADHCQVILN